MPQRTRRKATNIVKRTRSEKAHKGMNKGFGTNKTKRSPMKIHSGRPSPMKTNSGRRRKV